MQKGFITPTKKKAEGVGTKSLFTKSDVYKIELFQEMLRLGFKREEASMFLYPKFIDEKLLTQNFQNSKC